MHFIFEKCSSIDKDDIIKFISKYFYPYNALYTLIGVDSEEILNFESTRIMENIENGICVLARHEKTNEIVGLSMGRLYKMEKYKNYLSTKAANSKMRPIYELHSSLFQKAVESIRTFNGAKIFDFDLLCVNPEFSGKTIASRLVKKLLSLAQESDYNLAVVIIFNVYSKRIFEKSGAIMLCEIKFEDYVDEKGQQIFNPAKPHNISTAFYTIKLKD